MTVFRRVEWENAATRTEREAKEGPPDDVTARLEGLENSIEYRSLLSHNEMWDHAMAIHLAQILEHLRNLRANM